MPILLKDLYAQYAEAFTIFARYGTGDIIADHNTLQAGPNPENVSEQDRDRLKQLGWAEDDEYRCFIKRV